MKVKIFQEDGGDKEQNEEDKKREKRNEKHRAQTMPIAYRRDSNLTHLM